MDAKLLMAAYIIEGTITRRANIVVTQFLLLENTELRQRSARRSQECPAVLTQTRRMHPLTLTWGRIDSEPELLLLLSESLLLDVELLPLELEDPLLLVELELAARFSCSAADFLLVAALEASAAGLLAEGTDGASSAVSSVDASPGAAFDCFYG